MDPIVLGLFDQFLSTFKEWHYFVVGLSLGGLGGWILRAFLDQYTRF